MLDIVSCLFTAVVAAAMLTLEMFLLPMVFQMRFEFQFCVKTLWTKVALVMMMVIVIANEFIQDKIKMVSI